MTFLWILAIGLGSMKLTELAKEVIPWPLQTWTRSALSIAIAGALSAWHSADLRSTVLLGLAAAGAAMLLHEVQAVLSYIGDRAKQDVIIRGAGRSRL